MANREMQTTAAADYLYRSQQCFRWWLGGGDAGVDVIVPRRIRNEVMFDATFAGRNCRTSSTSNWLDLCDAEVCGSSEFRSTSNVLKVKR